MGFEMNEFLILIAVIISVNFLIFIAQIISDLWETYMTVKNRKIIRHWDWLRTMGHEEAALIILQKIKQ